MKSTTTAAALLAAALTLPAWAQEPSDESYGEEVPAEENAPAPAPETTPDASAEEAAATPMAADATDTGMTDAGSDASSDTADASADTADTASTEFAPSDDAGSDMAASDGGDFGADEPAEVEEREPFHLYAGLDLARTKLNLSDRARELRLGGDEPRSDMYRLRVGTRLFDAIGLEAHLGVADDKDDEPGRFEVDQALGLYLVPTGVAFNLLEISVPVGYNMFTAKRGANEVELDGVSYGVNLEVPVAIDSDLLPDLRIGGGGMVYQAHERSRVWGYHFGVRMDFQL